MSLLAPFFFFGAAAIGLPILFHLIRRQPTGALPFSSLMFLRPTPPRLTRRSRLDNWPLLLIRTLAILLFAAAFTRPFFRSDALLQLDPQGQRTVIAIDTSASMQRSGVWTAALAEAERVIADLQPQDQIAVVAFDRKPTTLFSFASSSKMPFEQRQASARRALEQLKPSWMSTDLGLAVQHCAELAVNVEENLPDEQVDSDAERPTENQSAQQATVVLISDMQQGALMESLQVYSWPKQTTLDVRPVRSERRTNAWAQILAPAEESSTTNPSQDATGKLVHQRDPVRVRVSNAAESERSRFQIGWGNSNDQITAEMSVQVPPGESRVVRMPTPGTDVTSIRLQGDDHDFDNTRYLVQPDPEAVRLLYLGDDADQAGPRESLFYYLNRVPLDNERRTVTVEARWPPSEGLGLEQSRSQIKTTMIVVGSPVSAETSARLLQFANDGGSVLFVLADADDHQAWAATLRACFESDAIQVSEGSVKDYLMLSRIDFQHPLFATMSDPQFNDFTKVRFWSNRKIEGLTEPTQTIASFDNGDAAILQRDIGNGRFWVLTAGWQPSGSQLALSTKFIPMIFQLFDFGQLRDQRRSDSIVGTPINLERSDDATITHLQGQNQHRSQTELALKDRNAKDLETINVPGIYRYDAGGVSRTFAVNLDSVESQSDPIDPDTFSRFGVVLGKAVPAEQADAVRRQLQGIELEKRQKLWQWLILLALVLLGLETWLSGRASQSGQAALSSDVSN